MTNSYKASIIKNSSDEAHQVYEAPKIAAELWKAGETISVKTVENNHMNGSVTQTFDLKHLNKNRKIVNM